MRRKIKLGMSVENLFKRLVGFVLLPLWCGAAESYTPQIADPMLEPWRWTEMTELSNLEVLCMDEAKDGSLWFGCIGGLAKYDGLQLKRIQFDEGLISRIEPNPDRETWVKSVLCMRDGSLLALVESSLVHWVNGVWEVILIDTGYSKYGSQLERADDGSVWMFTPDALWHFSEDFSEQQVVLRSTEEHLMTAFCRDKQGDIWIVCNTHSKSSELLHISLENGAPVEQSMWHRYGIEAPARHSYICAGPAGKIWYIDYNTDSGVMALDPRTGTWETVKDPESKHRYYSLMKDKTGKLWAGGSGFLYAIDPTEGRYYSPFQLGFPSIPLTVYETSAGQRWVFGRGGYVYTMDPSDRQWLTYLNLNFECESADGVQWFIAANRRIVSYDPATSQWLQYTRDEVISRPKSLYASSNGMVWAVGSHGTGRAAFSVFDGTGWTRYDHSGFAAHIGAGAVYEASDGTMWFGAMGGGLSDIGDDAGGALQYEITASGDIRLLKHHTPPNFPDFIHRFAETRDGSFWLGERNLQRRDVGSSVLITPAFSELVIRDLVVDGNEDLWISMELFGVYRLEKKVWRPYTMANGLAGKLVNDLLPLHDGTLLAASDRGISRFDGKSWTSQMFGEDFGVSSDKTGGMRQSADGSVWFNFSNNDARSPRYAMNFESKDRYCAVRYRADRGAPNTTVKQHPERVDSAGNIYLSWSGRDLWANTPTEKLQFSWRINQGEWSTFSYATGRAFLDMDSGSYTLEVRARDRDFNIDPTPALSGFTVIPPVWKRLWFIGMVLLLVVGAAGFIILLIYFRDKRLKDRARHLMELDQMKTGFFTNISHELNTPLGLIKGPLERMLETETDANKEKLLDMAMRNVNRVSNLVSQILDFRKLEQGCIRIEAEEGDISKLVRESVDLLQPLAKAQQVSVVFECEEPCYGWFDPEKLKKIVSNLVGNAVKYTPSLGNVRIVLKTVQQTGGRRMLSIVVEDTGSGIPPEHLPRIFERFYRVPEKVIVDGSGIGLNLTKELVQLWGGQIRAVSPIYDEPDCPGTRFSVLLPIDLEDISNRGVDHEK